MLVLTQKQNDKIEIGGKIIIEILGSKIHLNITSLPEGTNKELTCYPDEEIQIGQDIKVVITEIISSKKVRMGIIAPQDMGIVRLPKETEENKQ